MKQPYLFAVLASLALSSSVPRQYETQSHSIFSLFVFGDSYSSSGFSSNEDNPSPSTAQPLGFPPLGTSPDNLLGNPLIANQSTSNGPNWVEYLTARFNTTTTLTYDFAISGASIPDGFTDQILNLYEPRYSSLYGGGGETGWTSNSSTFGIWIGINDINWCSLLFTTTPNVTFEECLPPRIDAYFNLMDNLYITGARNFFFINMPPLDRAPMVFEHGQDIIENYARGVKVFNQQLLPRYVGKFKEAHPGTRAVVYDAHAFFSKILDHPTWYGFKDGRCYSCIGCRNVTGCFWSNNYHPVWQVHERLAEDMVQTLGSVGWPVES